MTPVLEKDASALRDALRLEGDEMSVSLSRSTAEMVARFVDAQAAGQEVVVTHGLQEVTTTQAARMLGMSRPQVAKLLEQGKLPYRLGRVS